MRIFKPVLFVCMLLAFAGQTHALSIYPGISDPLPNPPQSIWTGTQTSQAAINVAIGGILGTSIELYKQNVGGSEEGSLASSYVTTFYNTPSDPSGALIDYVGGPYVGPIAFLLVKDGNQTPAWYLFNLTDFGWNGTDDLLLSGFWPAQGAISHVTLYGHAVPEPAIMLLLGLGLIGLGGYSRKKFKSN
jgi:hypothetical protein